MSRVTKDLNHYKKLLPKEVTVVVHTSRDGGLWAQIKELPNCYTQADSYFELVEMVNDAIYTYLDVPVKYRKEIGSYVPTVLIRRLRDVRQRMWQNFFNELIKKENLKNGSEKYRLETSLS